MRGCNGAIIRLSKISLVAILLMSSGPAPEFVAVTACGELLVPTFWLPKVTLVVESVIVAGTPVPVRLTL